MHLEILRDAVLDRKQGASHCFKVVFDAEDRNMVIGLLGPQ